MIYYAHSGFRYLVLLFGLLVVGYAIFALATKRPYDQTMRALAAAFLGSLDLTALLGFGVLFTGRFYTGLGGHIVTMLLAMVVVHVVYAVMKRRPQEERTHMPHVVATVVALALVVMGILSIGRPIVG